MFANRSEEVTQRDAGALHNTDVETRAQKSRRWRVPDMCNNKAEKISAEEMKRPSFKSTNLICSSRKLILAETD